MVQARDIADNEIWFGDTYFPIVGPVKQTSITVVPNPVIFGDTAKRGDTQTLSQFMQANAKGGSGIYRGNARTDAERSWTSECDTRWDFVTLPQLETSIGKPGAAGATTDPNMLLEFNNEVYAAWGSDLFIWKDGTVSWSALERTLPAIPTGWAEYKGVLYVATGARIDRRTAAGSWATPGNLTIDASYLANFASKLYAIGLTSGIWTLRWSAIGDFSETAPAGGWPIIGETNLSVRGMLVYRDAAGARRLWISTSKGWWIFDENSNTISPSEVLWTADTNAGKSPRLFRDGRIYVPQGGLSVLQVQGGNPIVAQPVGLDRDDQVPTTEQSSVVALETDTNWLYAMLDGTVAGTATPDIGQSATTNWFSSGMWPDAATGVSTIRAYSSGPGWHQIWKSTGSAFAGMSMLVSMAYGKRRLYWGADRKVWYMELPAGLYNPRVNPNIKFTARACEHITPWWFLTSELETKLVPHFLLQLRDASATESVDVYYGTDLDDNSWTLLTTVTSNDLQTIKLASGQGTTGRWWRFRLVLRRGSTSTSRPLVILWGPQFMPLLTAEYGFSVEIDTSSGWRDKTPQQLDAALRRLSDPAQTGSLQEFAFEDDLSGEAQTYLARIMRFQASKLSGRGNRGKGRWLVSIIVPSKADAI